MCCAANDTPYGIVIYRSFLLRSDILLHRRIVRLDSCHYSIKFLQKSRTCKVENFFSLKSKIVENLFIFFSFIQSMIWLILSNKQTNKHNVRKRKNLRFLMIILFKPSYQKVVRERTEDRGNPRCHVSNLFKGNSQSFT